MNIFLLHKLQKIGRRAKPSKDFVIALEKKLINIHAVFSPVKTVYQPMLMRFASVALSVVFMFGMGTSVYAYSSEDVLPDHPLYGLRQAMEVAEEKAAIMPAWKQRVVKKHLERKQKEIQRMLLRRPSLKDLPEGEDLQSIETILSEGVSGQKDPSEVREEVLKEVRDMQLKNIDPVAKRRLKRIERRMDWMQGLHKR